jgi:hypothetical protein
LQDGTQPRGQFHVVFHKQQSHAPHVSKRMPPFAIAGPAG